MSLANVVKLDDEEKFVGGEPSGVELCLGKFPSLLDGRVQSPAAKVGEMGSKKQKVSSSMTSVGKRRDKTATRGESGEEDEIREAESEEMAAEMDEEDVASRRRKISLRELTKWKQ